MAAYRRAACVLCAVQNESLKTETCRSDIIVHFNVNLKLLTKLINGAFFNPKHVGAILNIFKYFIIILNVSTNYIFVHLLDNKVF